MDGTTENDCPALTVTAVLVPLPANELGVAAAPFTETVKFAGTAEPPAVLLTPRTTFTVLVGVGVVFAVTVAVHVDVATVEDASIA